MFTVLQNYMPQHDFVSMYDECMFMFTQLSTQNVTTRLCMCVERMYDYIYAIIDPNVTTR